MGGMVAAPARGEDGDRFSGRASPYHLELGTALFLALGYLGWRLLGGSR